MQTTKLQNYKNNYVFLNAHDAAIQVKVNNVLVAHDVQTADALVQVFLTHNICVVHDTIMCSSDVDFASEEGWGSDYAAHEVIDDAIMQLQ